MSQMPNQNAPNAGSTQLVVVGVVLAVIAVVLVNVYVEMRAASQNEDTVTVFRFKVAKDRGDIIKEGDLETIEIPSDFEDAFGDAMSPSSLDAEMPEGGWGETLNQSVRKNEVLRFSMVQSGTLDSAGRDVDRGTRIFALKVDSSEQPRNLARGDYIDVLGEFGRGTGVMYVAQRLEVVQVGDRLNSQSEDGSRVLRYNNISIQVSPDEVLSLKALEKLTVNEQFSITVRADDDYDITITTKEDSVLNQELLRRMGLDD
ncbi:MAG: hypothetical protein AAGH88_01825 [Planctomycetota bacterium]